MQAKSPRIEIRPRDIRWRSTPINTRWASIANTHFQQGGMALRRALEHPWEQEP